MEKKQGTSIGGVTAVGNDIWSFHDVVVHGVVVFCRIGAVSATGALFYLWVTVYDEVEGLRDLETGNE